MGPLGLSGSLFLGLLVFDFYHPTNRDLYLVAVVAVGRIWLLGVFLGEILTFFQFFWKLFLNCLSILLGLKRPT